jgi:hypothetical protein
VRRASRQIGGTLLVALLLALGAEFALQIAARFAPDRSTPWRSGAQVRILCVGDSHTFGAGVEPEESYPAQLQALLDERAAGRFSLVNLGVPGMSTTQVRNRLPLQVARYRPDVVIVWAGVNDYWNTGETPGDGSLGRLEALAIRSRLYRLVRVWLHDRALERAPGRREAGGFPRRWSTSGAVAIATASGAHGPSATTRSSRSSRSSSSARIRARPGIGGALPPGRSAPTRTSSRFTRGSQRPASRSWS